MNTYSIYDVLTGSFNGSTITCAPHFLADNVPIGYGAVLGVYDCLCEKVDPFTGLVVAYQPPAPSGNHEWDDQTKRWVYVPTLEDQRAAAMVRVNDACAHAIKAVTAGYPDAEMASWPKQEAEAREFSRAPGDAVTPLLSAIAAARGMALEDLAVSVLSKATAFAEASGALLGRRKVSAERVADATDKESLDAIVDEWYATGSSTL